MVTFSATAKGCQTRRVNKVQQSRLWEVRGHARSKVRKSIDPCSTQRYHSPSLHKYLFLPLDLINSTSTSTSSSLFLSVLLSFSFA